MSNELKTEGIFDGAVLYLFDYYQNPREVVVQEGVTERHGGKHTPGTTWIYDGETVLERAMLVICKPKTGIRDTSSTQQLEDLVGLVRKEADDDHTYLINTKAKTTTKVKGGLANSAEGVNIEALCEKLPLNFLSLDGSVPIYNTGQRTDSAMVTAYVLNKSPLNDGTEVRVIAVKDTAYANTDFGKIAEFGSGGLLCREFFFMSDPKHEGPYLDAKNSLVGICREYRPGKERVELVSEKYVSITPKGKVQYTPKTDARRMAA